MAEHSSKVSAIKHREKKGVLDGSCPAIGVFGMIRTDSATVRGLERSFEPGLQLLPAKNLLSLCRKRLEGADDGPEEDLRAVVWDDIRGFLIRHLQNTPQLVKVPDLRWNRTYVSERKEGYYSENTLGSRINTKVGRPRKETGLFGAEKKRRPRSEDLCWAR